MDQATTLAHRRSGHAAIRAQFVQSHRYFLPLWFWCGIYTRGHSLKSGPKYLPRKTYTDYLDDVSADYYDLNKIRVYSSDIAAKLAYRETEWNFDNIPDVDGIQRGNPNNNDWYIIHQVSIYYMIGAQKNLKR